MTSELEAVRDELVDVPGFGPERERALVARILARTTRSAPARGARVRAWWLAFAAAAVASGAGTLSFLARGTARGPELAARTALDERGARALAREALASAASGARSPRAVAELAADAPLELRLLEARARGLRERRWDPWLREVPLSDVGTLSLALWFEVQLDRYLLSGSRPPAWKHAVGILERDLARAETPARGSKLLAHALDRARDYGLTGDVAVARLDPARSPWTGQWFDDLDAAGREAGVADSGVWRAWVDWRGR